MDFNVCKIALQKFLVIRMEIDELFLINHSIN